MRHPPPHHELLDVLAEFRQPVTPVDLDLDALVARHEGSDPRQALLPAAAHPDEHRVASGLPQHPADPRDVDHRVREEHEVHLVRERDVVLVEAVVQYLPYVMVRDGGGGGSYAENPRLVIPPS